MGDPVYYNEIEPQAAAWLQSLMDADAIPLGHIDTRSIEDVTPNDLRGFIQCHFFAGIGGWAYALDLAGWPRGRPVWTGSCPCQPFSAAGKGAGFEDERHLWPAWQHLIAQCRPPVIFGEQVASKAVDPWIDLVHADLEGLGYAFGCVPFPAAGVGAPHIRDRSYWAASNSDADIPGLQGSVWGGLAGPENASSAWRSIERVHTARTWSSWLSESGIGPLADGLPARVGRLRGYGNAIVPQQAAEFIVEFLEATGELTCEAAA